MLALDGHGVVVLVNCAVFAFGAAFEPVAGVDLHGGLGGEDLQMAAGNGAPELGGGGKLAGQGTVNQVAVVVALAVLQRRLYLSSPQKIASTV